MKKKIKLAKKANAQRSLEEGLTSVDSRDGGGHGARDINEENEIDDGLGVGAGEVALGGPAVGLGGDHRKETEKGDQEGPHVYVVVTTTNDKV